MTYDEQLDEYAEHVTLRFNRGRITERKYFQLIAKIDAWFDVYDEQEDARVDAVE